MQGGASLGRSNGRHHPGRPFVPVLDFPFSQRTAARVLSALLPASAPPRPVRRGDRDPGRLLDHGCPPSAGAGAAGRLDVARSRRGRGAAGIPRLVEGLPRSRARRAGGRGAGRQPRPGDRHAPAARGAPAGRARRGAVPSVVQCRGADAAGHRGRRQLLPRQHRHGVGARPVRRRRQRARSRRSGPGRGGRGRPGRARGRGGGRGAQLPRPAGGTPAAAAARPAGRTRRPHAETRAGAPAHLDRRRRRGGPGRRAAGPHACRPGRAPGGPGPRRPVAGGAAGPAGTGPGLDRGRPGAGTRPRAVRLLVPARRPAAHAPRHPGRGSRRAQGRGRRRHRPLRALPPLRDHRLAAVRVQHHAQPPHHQRQRAGHRPDDRHPALRLGTPPHAGGCAGGGAAERHPGLPAHRARRRRRGRRRAGRAGRAAAPCGRARRGAAGARGTRACRRRAGAAGPRQRIRRPGRAPRRAALQADAEWATAQDARSLAFVALYKALGGAPLPAGEAP